MFPKIEPDERTPEEIIEELESNHALWVGMKRDEIYTHFTSAGGFSTPRHRIFFYRRNARVLIDVTFKPYDELHSWDADPWRTPDGRDDLFDKRDTVIEIVGPYIGWPAWD